MAMEHLLPDMSGAEIDGRDEDGVPTVLYVAAEQEACGSRWDFHAGRGAGDCDHRAVLWVRDEDNPGLPRGSYQTPLSAPLIIEARRWHAPNGGGLLETFALDLTYSTD